MGAMTIGLCVITDEVLAPGCSHILIAEEALKGGAGMIQLRDKRRSGVELYNIATRINKLCKNLGSTFIVNDRLDIALASGADGVHLGQQDLPLTAARRLAPSPFIIGISVKTVEEAIEAEKNGADYLGVGPVYPTGTKPDAGPDIGPGLIKSISENTKIPIIAIGGINLLNAIEVIKAGADGIAVISAVVCSPDISCAAKKFVDIIHSYSKK
jgi:thiamine-phosphate pyrophosphorylase